MSRKKATSASASLADRRINLLPCGAASKGEGLEKKEKADRNFTRSTRLKHTAVAIIIKGNVIAIK